MLSASIGLPLFIAALAVIECYAVAARSTATYLEPPAALDVAEGQTAVFSCHAQDALFIWWTVNGHGQDSPGFKELEAETVTDHDSNNFAISFSNLTLPAKDNTDDARVVCNLASNPGLPNPQPKDHVLLKVQGTYEPVRDISLTNISYSVTVLWSPPPYLPSIPPTGYNITVMNTTTNETISQGTVSVTNYTFELDPEHLCSILRIRVVAFSDLLGGYTADHVWSLGGAVEPNSILEQLRYIERDTLELSVRFKVAGFCLDQLLSIMLETICDNTTLVNITDASGIDTRGVVSGPHQLTVQELPEDARCSYQIVLFTVTNRTTPSQSMLYDTFDLANVQFNSSVRDRSICVECCFIDGSSALGCHSVQRNFRNKVVRSFNASRVNESLTTGLQCFEADPGAYTMIVYDINADSTLSDEPYTTTLQIVSTPTPSSSRSPVFTVTPTRAGAETDSNIVVIASGTVGGVAVIIAIIAIILVILLIVIWKKKRRTETDGIDLVDGPRQNPVDVMLLKMGIYKKDLRETCYICVVDQSVKNDLSKRQCLFGHPEPVYPQESLYPDLSEDAN